jgi:hypothetical protein
MMHEHYHATIHGHYHATIHGHQHATIHGHQHATILEGSPCYDPKGITGNLPRFWTSLSSGIWSPEPIVGVRIVGVRIEFSSTTVTQPF